MATLDRTELVRNAVAFLSDPNVSETVYIYKHTHRNNFQSQSSSLAQRIQFLEAKGLTAPEIEDALRQVGPNQSVQSYRPSYQTSYPPAYGPAPYAIAPPPSNQWDWRDYFVSLTCFSFTLRCSRIYDR